MKPLLITLAIALGIAGSAYANKSYSRILKPRATGKSKLMHKGWVGKPKVEKKEDGTVIIRKRKAGTRHRITTGPTSRRSPLRALKGKPKDKDRR